MFYALVIVAFLVIVFVAANAIATRTPDGLSDVTTTLSIAVSFLQVIASASRINVQWPDAVLAVLRSQN